MGGASKEEAACYIYIKKESSQAPLWSLVSTFLPIASISGFFHRLSGSPHGRLKSVPAHNWDLCAPESEQEDFCKFKDRIGNISKKKKKTKSILSWVLAFQSVR